MRLPANPALYQINTRVRLTDLSRSLGRPAALDEIGAAVFVGRKLDPRRGVVGWSSHESFRVGPLTPGGSAGAQYGR